MNSDAVERLRRDLIDYLGAAYFSGDFGAAMIEISIIERANEQELIYYARKFKFDLNRYLF